MPRFIVTLLVAAFSSLCFAATAGATLFFNATPINVPTTFSAAAPYPSSIAVSGVVGPLLNVRVTLVSVTDPAAAEIDALVVAPNGQNVLLMSDVCGDADVSDATLTFDDSAANAIGGVCTTGSYRPFDASDTSNFPSTAPAGPYGAALGPLGSGFNGTWKLFVRNNGSSNQAGTIGGWSLDLVDTIQPAPQPLVLTPRLCDSRHATMVGTDGGEALRGTPEDDVIVGLGGNDKINGFDGRDRICGGTENDRVVGARGKDRLLGGAGNDRLYGGPGRDTLDGGSGRDTCIDAGSDRGPFDEGRTTFLSCERVLAK
jgi:Ca2+-binding RTX toxin-like protein